MIKYKFIYGPVASWRLGRSLGVDLISTSEKKCNFDCVYCQIGRNSSYKTQRETFVKTEDILSEIRNLPKDLAIDYITFSGKGEPTLAANIGEVISEIKKVRQDKIAILTNSILLGDKQVRDEIKNADLIVCKLDGMTDEVLKKVNNPPAGITIEKILSGIEDLKREFSGKISLQIMFVQDNKHQAKDFADFARKINAQEVQINTPLRECGIKPLSPKEIDGIKKEFKGLNIISVYDEEREADKPINVNETQKRRGK